ncbi:uncharacterized protein LOC107474249 [Arachis duranensis]|uniref:Uncharacterized protein LOC107474249 n=1 Tax=Arachis duranensis TaxID=130453 RepID=A0A6P4CD73_ARADU|nr:uncharacterized protein LOC107474249 [Arachis duranensis]
MRRCPPDMFSDWVKLQNFYEGLSFEARNGLDYSSGGSLNMMKTAEEAQDLIEIVANNQYYYSSERQHNPAPKKGVMELEAVNATTQPLLEWNQGEGTNVEQPQEQVQYMQNTSNSQDEFHGDTYNPSWKNHPNLKWGENHWQKNNNHNHTRNTNNQNHHANNTNQFRKTQNTYQPPHINSQTHPNNLLAPTSNSQNYSQNYYTNPPNNFQQQSTPIIPPIDHHETRISSLEATLQALAQTTQALAKGHKEHEVIMKNIERQVGQLAKQAERPTNVLPSDTIPNPREECKALQLRSGKVVGESLNKEAIKPKEQDTVEIHVERQDEEKASTSNKSKEAVKPQGNPPRQRSNHDSNESVNPQQENKNEGVKAYVPKLPYPTRIHKGAKDQQFPRFLEIFKKLEINIPLAEALEQMPLYAKLKIFPGKLRSRWTGPYTITKVSPHGYVELLDEASKQTFTANGHRVKHYFGGP